MKVVWSGAKDCAHWLWFTHEWKWSLGLPALSFSCGSEGWAQKPRFPSSIQPATQLPNSKLATERRCRCNDVPRCLDTIAGQSNTAPEGGAVLSRGLWSASELHHTHTEQAAGSGDYLGRWCSFSIKKKKSKLNKQTNTRFPTTQAGLLILLPSPPVNHRYTPPCLIYKCWGSNPGLQAYMLG